LPKIGSSEKSEKLSEILILTTTLQSPASNICKQTCRRWCDHSACPFWKPVITTCIFPKYKKPPSLHFRTCSKFLHCAVHFFFYRSLNDTDLPSGKEIRQWTIYTLSMSESATECCWSHSRKKIHINRRNRHEQDTHVLDVTLISAY
jgi:hypothetical protein